MAIMESIAKEFYNKKVSTHMGLEALSRIIVNTLLCGYDEQTFFKTLDRMKSRYRQIKEIINTESNGSIDEFINKYEDIVSDTARDWENER